MKEFIEIPFSVKDSELGGWEYTIPEGYTASIENGKIIVKKEDSEDERIRKELLEHCKNQAKPYIYSGNECPQIQSWIDWLEKQGEKKSCMIQWKGDNLKEVIDFTGKDKNFDKWFKSFEEYEQYVKEHDGIFKLFNADGSHYEIPVGAWIVKTPDGYNVASKAIFKQKPVWGDYDRDMLDNLIEDESCLLDSGYISWFKNIKERFGNIEKKPVNKVEPKFHEGEWVVNRFGDVWYIDSFDSKNYQVSNGDKYCYFPIEKQNEMHLWTISDAKDGNVLCYKDEISLYRHDIKNCTKQETTFGGFVYYCCYDGKRFVVDSLYSLTEQDKMDIHPATKEQRDTLEKAMADAGYTFDFDKKELKKIQQKPAWSEEDEKILDSIIEDTMPYGECPDYPTDEEREYFYEGNRKVEWLKSLKDRYTWKPSALDILLLERIANGKSNPKDFQVSLGGLIGQLKKLKEE